MADIIDDVPEETPSEEELSLDPSILRSIMGRLGADPDDNTATSYKEDIMQSINGAIASLVLVGVGPSTGFRVTDTTAEWEDFLGESLLFESAKDYIFFRAKLEFDPPTAGITESFNAQMARALNDCKMNAEFPPD